MDDSFVFLFVKGGTPYQLGGNTLNGNKLLRYTLYFLLVSEKVMYHFVLLVAEKVMYHFVLFTSSRENYVSFYTFY